MDVIDLDMWVVKAVGGNIFSHKEPDPCPV